MMFWLWEFHLRWTKFVFFTYSLQSFTIVICYIVEAVATNNFRVCEVVVTSNSSIEVSHDLVYVVWFDLFEDDRDACHQEQHPR